jgi:ribonuclease D
LEYEYITAQDRLDAFCAKLAGCRYVAWDSEFVRQKGTYYPELCLVQIASCDGRAALIDMTDTGLRPDPLLGLLSDPAVVKIGHALRQDLEAFYYYDSGFVPRALWDTQIAALFCGEVEHVGYAYLAEKISGHRLSKGLQFSDWKKRPLGKKQAEYAMNDVRYLADIYEAQMRALAEKGRLAWAQEEMLGLVRDLDMQFSGETAFRKLHMTHRTLADPAALARLSALCAWREGEARRRNVARGDVLPDQAMTEPDSVHEALPEALAATPVSFVPFVCAPKQMRLDPDRRVLALMEMALHIAAEREGLPPGLIAKKAELACLPETPDYLQPFDAGWRREVFGKDARALAAGKAALAVREGRAALVAV